MMDNYDFSYTNGSKDLFVAFSSSLVPSIEKVGMAWGRGYSAQGSGLVVDHVPPKIVTIYMCDTTRLWTMKSTVLTGDQLINLQLLGIHTHDWGSDYLMLHYCTCSYRKYGLIVWSSGNSTKGYNLYAWYQDKTINSW